MNKFTNPLENLKIASPCSADWDQMIGDERKRFCGSCRLNVYNLSGMTKNEAENLLVSNEGKLCVRFYKRADGTVLTDDCPVGWAAVKRRISRVAAAFASLIFGIVGGLGISSLFSGKEERQIMGTIPVNQLPAITPKPLLTPDEVIMGGIEKDEPIQPEIKMGKVAFKR